MTKTQLQAKQMAAGFLLKTDSCFFKKQMILVSSWLAVLLEHTGEKVYA